MNNSIGSFDHFSFREDPADDIEIESDILSSEEDEVSIPDPIPTKLKTRGPAIKKSILCDEEFVPMTKKVKTTEVEDTQAEVPQHLSDAPKKTAAAKETGKKKRTKKIPAQASSGKSQVTSKKTTDQTASPPKKSRRKATSKKDSLEGEQHHPPPEPTNPKQPKSKVVKKKANSKKPKKVQVTEDIKLQLINWISSTF